MTMADEIAAKIIEENTCGYTGCTNHPDWRVATVRIYTTDGGEAELAYESIPINRICHEHKKDQATHKQIANRAWTIILRSLEIDNPQYINEIHKGIRLRRFVIGWQRM